MVTRRLHLLLLTGIFTLLPLAETFAQSTGGIRGTVFNKDNEPVPGATVVIINAELGVQQGAVTDAKGEYRVAPLAPGKGYSVRVEFPGMGKVTIPDVEVTASRMTVVPVTLRPDKEMETKIRVVATTEVVNTESTTTQTTISSEYIDALPILGRNYQDVLTLAPGVTDVDGDGNPNIHGARDTDVATLVDGVSTVNPLTGMVGQQLNINSIQEIEVKTSGASAEFGRAQGGFVTIVTKSGGNDFEGSFRIDWRGNTLDGDGAGIDDSQLHGGLTQNGLRDLTFNDIYPQVTVSGPLKKDKAWYFVTAEYRQEETPVNALTQAFVQTHDETRLFAKATWQMSTNHKLVFTATFDPQVDYNLGITSFRALESGFTFEQGGRNLVLRETAVFSPNVFLDTTVQDFVDFPQVYGTTDPDTNGNGDLFFDRNHNGFIDATERDPGEDFDRDGVFDVFEDADKDGNLDPNEDKDGDSRLTQSASNGIGGGCEGTRKEDSDCDGHLDKIPEVDSNNNGLLDPNEDLDHDGHFDSGTEDRNDNNILDDRPNPADFNSEIKDENQIAGNYYPYAETTPTSRDRDYEQDQRTLRTSGPYLFDSDGETGRQTLRQDLTIFVPDWHGQHELKTGYSIEREHYSQGTNLRPFMLPNLAPPASSSFIPTIGAILPAENHVDNSAKALAGALYVQDTYKPLPNLTLNLGLRFERETTDSFGYTQFDPAAERASYDRLSSFIGNEVDKDDALLGNNDGIKQQGFCSDPLWGDLPGGQVPCKASANDSAVLFNLINTLKKASLSRLTEHHTATTLVAANLQQLFPGAIKDVCTNGVCEKVVDRELLAQQGAVFQEEEPFRLTNNNLAPRIALSWDPWSDSKTKIFASWSRFYDKLFLNTIIPEEGPDQISRYYRKDQDGITGSGIPDNGVGNVISKAPPSTSQVDRGLQTPFTDEWSIGFERELAPEVSIRISYIDRSGRLGLQDRDINHAVRYNADGSYQDGNGRVVPSGNDGAGGTRVADNVPDLYTYNFFFNQILRYGNYNTSQYKGIELELVKRLSRKWQMDTSYTYSRAQGFAEDFNSNLGNDPASIPYTYGYLNFDQRHVIRLNGTTFLPGDWTAGGVLSWTSGLPYSVISTVNDLDNFDYLQQRTLFGRIVPTNDGKGAFQGEHRNSRRNASILNINLQATKAFVMGRFNSKLFFTVENVLNRDNLQINTYEPDNPNRSGALQLNATRDFGRRFRIAFQFEF